MDRILPPNSKKLAAPLRDFLFNHLGPHWHEALAIAMTAKRPLLRIERLQAGWRHEPPQKLASNPMKFEKRPVGRHAGHFESILSTQIRAARAKYRNQPPSEQITPPGAAPSSPAPAQAPAAHRR